jgi:hypothetical protein
MATDVLAMMDSELKRAKEAAKSGSFVPTFLRLNDGQKARIRPLFNLTECVVLPMHNKFNKSNPKESINAVCGLEVGDDCPYCEAVASDKALSASTVFMLPVYVSVIEQQDSQTGLWSPVTYKKDDKEVEVSGLRILELKSFGAVSSIFETIRDLYREDDKHDIRQYGLIIQRVGAFQQTSYTILPKGPSQMPDAAKALIPSSDDVKKMVLAACPPAGTSSSSSSSSSVTSTNGKVSERDNDF